jgi:hypothetical protein
VPSLIAVIHFRRKQAGLSNMASQAASIVEGSWYFNTSAADCVEGLLRNYHGTLIKMSPSLFLLALVFHSHPDFA